MSGKTLLVIPATALHRGGNQLRLEKEGAGGVAHLTAVLDYIAPPASIWAMYMPAVRAQSRPWSVTVAK